MIQSSPRRPAITVGRPKEVPAEVPDGHGLVPSHVYNLLVVDGNGRNRGYISMSGELHWWPAAPGRPTACSLPVGDATSM